MPPTAPTIRGRLSYGDGLQLGLPRQVWKGRTVTDTATGISYVWIDEPGGLHDLGFWGAFVSAVAGPLMGLFGGGGPKPDNAARQMLQQQQGQLSQLQQTVEAQSFLNPRNVFLLAIVGLAAVMAFRK